MTPSDTNKTDNTEIEQLLRDFNGYDFCERNECPGQAKANELIKYLETIIAQRIEDAMIAYQKELAADYEADVAQRCIEELNYVRGFGERGGHDVYCRTIGEAVLDRIAALSKAPKEKDTTVT